MRCPYCLVEKSATWMREPVIAKALEICVHESNPEITIHFFGGEPLLDVKNLISITERIAGMAQDKQKKVSFFLSTNCMNVDSDVVDLIREYNFSLKLSIDGKYGAGDRINSKTDSGILDRIVSGAVMAMNSTNNYYVNAVVSPDTAAFLRDNIEFLASIGARKIQVAPAVGLMWTKSSLETLSRQLMHIYENFISKNKFQFLNLDNDAKNFLFNREITVDCDGAIYAGNVFLFSPPEVSSKFLLGNVNDGNHAYSYFDKSPPFDYYVRNIFPPEVMITNMSFVRILDSFRRFVKSSYIA